jgi:hypothetical protein
VDFSFLLYLLTASTRIFLARSVPPDFSQAGVEQRAERKGDGSLESARGISRNKRCLMKAHSVDHTLREQPPSEAQRHYGILTAGVIALIAIGTTIYWIA